MPDVLRTLIRKTARACAVAILATLGATAAAQEAPLIIDAATGQQIRVNGLSDQAMNQLSAGGEVFAQTATGNRIVLRGEIYRPGIWTDPDGCQHWVMDDGIEGFMAPILTPQGLPICNGAPVDVGNRAVIMKYDVPYRGKMD